MRLLGGASLEQLYPSQGDLPLPSLPSLPNLQEPGNQHGKDRSDQDMKPGGREGLTWSPRGHPNSTRLSALLGRSQGF